MRCKFAATDRMSLDDYTISTLVLLNMSRKDTPRKPKRNERGEDSSRSQTRIPARRGQRDTDNRARDHSDSDLTDISLRIQSRFPKLTDYDQTSHTYRESYVHPKSYPIGVTACNGLITTDPGEIGFNPPVGDPRDPGRGDDAPDGPVHPQRQKEIPQRVPDNIVAWRWRLERSNGEVVHRVRHRANLGPEACQARLVAPELGRYRVHLTLELADGEQTASRWFRIRNDRLIVSIGDSYASGEGVPDRPGLNTVWVEPEAHRSFRAGPALAAKDWENTIEGDLVSFLSFATSGAEFDRGLFKPQDDWQAIGQIKEAKRAIGDRTIDALLISIGGNDIGFADVLKILALDPSRRVASIALNRVAEEIEKLEDNFDELEKQIRKLNPDHVFITEYPIAHFDRKDGTARGGCGTFSLVNVDEANSVKQLGERLNETVEAAANDHNWTFVDGVVNGFRGRGYCESDDRYFVTLSESRRSQGNIKGTMHPNRKGHRIYADRITAALQRQIDGQNETGGDRGPIVRDHRTEVGNRSDRDSGPTVRDHRTNRGSQRDTGRRENVRDHRV